MALDHTLAAIPAGMTNRRYGTAYWDGSRWWAEVGGNYLDARWLDPIQPLQGGKIVVDITTEGRGQSSALVVGGYTDQPRPSTGTVLTVGITEVVFTGDDGGTYSTNRFVNPYVPPAIPGDPPRLVYAPGDPVYLTWDAARPTIIGIIAAIAPPPIVGTPVPPPVVATGTEVMTATASDTFAVGGWGRWAGGGENVYSGSWGGISTTGSFFYGAPKPALQGKTITAIRFRIPQRLRVGSYNSAATVHLYAHTSQSRPGGDVARVAGPFDISVAAGQGPSWVNISSAHPAFAGIASTLAAGGGISFAGDPYTGWTSRLIDPMAGQIELDWSA